LFFVGSCCAVVGCSFSYVQQRLDVKESKCFIGCEAEGVQGAIRMNVLSVIRCSPCGFFSTQALSMRFNGEITDDRITTSSFFPDEYFSCSNVCLSCGARCTKNMNHLKDNVAHTAKSRCRYTHQYNNKVLICRVCYERGLEVSVNPKTSASTDSKWFGLATYAWS
ncbi:hypothetical protein scyTo_0022676, partial [Scyliorhinus torazame]|nr:hypothetical protein [Scyliorhinus torazame]